MKPAALLACALILLPSAGRACLQDRDSLETEARGVPDVMRALSGRFERNPPLFYQMRMQRVQAELKAAPARLDLYDDIAVAADRLNRDDEALSWIEKKRARLQVLDAKQPEVREHWYRYFANAGTFRLHRWIAQGANRQKLSEVKIARNLIAKAIAIKPGAHFGREKYQLKTMDWILYPPSAKCAGDGLPDILGLCKDDEVWGAGVGQAELEKLGYGDAERGLTGLITLGAAWESIDVFNALRYVEAHRWDSSVLYLLGLRLREMAKEGRTSLYPGAPSSRDMAYLFEPRIANFNLGAGSPSQTKPEQLEAIYKRLRAEADDWHARRTAFMLERLNAGRHPDTDPTFWNGWDDGAPPSLEPPTTAQDVAKIIANQLPLIVVVSTGLFLLVMLRRERRQRRAAA